MARIDIHGFTPLQAAARNGLNYLKMMTKKSVGGTAPSSGAGGGSSNGK